MSKASAAGFSVVRFGELGQFGMMRKPWMKGLRVSDERMNKLNFRNVVLFCVRKAKRLRLLQEQGIYVPMWAKRNVTACAGFMLQGFHPVEFTAGLAPPSHEHQHGSAGKKNALSGL